MSTSSADCEFDVNVEAGDVDLEVLMPFALLCVSLLCSMGSIHSMYKIWKQSEFYFMAKASYLSIGILTILTFQFFGVFLVLGLTYASQYFQYLTVAGINSFLASFTTNKMSYIFFMTQNANHPLINEPGFQSPRVRFYMFLVIAQLVFYVAGFMLIRYPAFSWYALILYIYPLVHIISTVSRGSRKNFRW